MALRKSNPVTPGTRQLVQVDRRDLYKGEPVKALTEGLTKSGGRNNAGRITARRRGSWPTFWHPSASVLATGLLPAGVRT